MSGINIRLLNLFIAKILVAAILAAVFLTGCDSSSKKLHHGNARDESMKCRNYGGIPYDVCPVSMLWLIANSDTANSHVIAVKGSVELFEGMYYLFPNRSFAESKDLSNSIRCHSGCERLSSMVGKDATLIGRFSSSTDDLGLLFSPAGEIATIKIRELD